MKKVLVLAVAVLFVSGTGFAVITGSGHDFAADPWATEICLPCHTPHDGDMANGAPLWNHEITATSFTLYTGVNGTLDATVGQPTGVSKLCLSCHDGSVALENYGSTTTGTTFVTGAALVGTDLSNDHPVSFTYDAALVVLDPELNDPASGPVSALLFSGNVECASCHDVHNTAGIANLLVMNNAGSALCLTCHAK